MESWNHFQSLWVTLVSLCDHVGIAFGSVWVHFGITLGSLCGQFMITLGSCWIHFGITLVSFMFNLVSIRNKFGIDLGRRWDPSLHPKAIGQMNPTGAGYSQFGFHHIASQVLWEYYHFRCHFRRCARFGLDFRCHLLLRRIGRRLLIFHWFFDIFVWFVFGYGTFCRCLNLPIN